MVCGCEHSLAVSSLWDVIVGDYDTVLVKKTVEKNTFNIQCSPTGSVLSTTLGICLRVSTYGSNKVKSCGKS